jgi:arylsulfatase A-like enzyme
MLSRYFTFAVALCASLLIGSIRLAAAPPNIVFILADDLGYTDLACYGSRYYETPSIDKLAGQGIRFLNHHHCQNCTPTRAAILGGQHPARTGIYTVGGIDRFDWTKRPLRPVDNLTQLPLDRDTIAQQMKKAGYATAMFGKWHIGESGKYHPCQRGFDQAIVSAGKHFDFETNPKVQYTEGQYLADFLTDKAVEFIDQHHREPFFLYLPHFGVHGPHEAKPELIERFKKKEGITDSDGEGHNSPTYAAMIASVDESVGRILDTLDRLKIADHTIVIFASDNGGVGGYVREGIKKSGGITDNAPLRSGKGSLYEGGTRVPLIVRWPNHIRSGTSCNVPTIHVDLYATLLELGSAPKPNQILDGQSIVPLMLDQGGFEREAIYQHFPGYLGAGVDAWRTTPVSTICMGNWKLMEFLEDGRLELYNLEQDIGESMNLAQTNPTKAKELYQRLVTWRKEIQAPMPAINDGTNLPKIRKQKDEP